MPSKDALVKRAHAAVVLPKERIALPVMCFAHPITGCGRLAGKRRGVCDSCYELLMTAIRDHVMTDDEAVAAGLLKPHKRQAMRRMLSVILARRVT